MNNLCTAVGQTRNRESKSFQFESNNGVTDFHVYLNQIDISVSNYLTQVLPSMERKNKYNFRQKKEGQSARCLKWDLSWTILLLVQSLKELF